MASGWSSWALGRLTMSPEALVDRVRRDAGLPARPEVCEIVELHLAALDVSLDVGAPELLVPQLRWEMTRWAQVDEYSSMPSIWPALHAILAEQLDEMTLLAVVHHVTEADTAALAELSRSWVQRRHRGLVALGGPAQTYLAHAVEGRHELAVRHVHGLVDAGASVSDVLLGVIAPVQRELGRLWERGAVNVAQEHLATAVAQVTMSSLYPWVFDGPTLGHTLVAATPPGDTHEVGLRIVTDLLQLRGWDTRFVGAACPVRDVVDAVAATSATLLLLGASMTKHLVALRVAVEEVRSDPRCDGVTVLVGGEPFRHAGGLAEWVGADLVATTAQEAVEAADRLAGLREATGV